MSTALATDNQTIQGALDVLADGSLSVDDRAGAYAVLYTIQLRLNRALRTVKDELIAHMEGNHLKALGPLTVKATSIDPHYPVNDEGNWGDAQVQEELEAFSKIAPDFIRHVPAHYEIRTFELGQAVHAGDPLARQLWKECNDRRWRVEEGKRLSLAVQEVKPPKEKA